jgi:hypothetical protein
VVQVAGEDRESDKDRLGRCAFRAGSHVEGWCSSSYRSCNLSLASLLLDPQSPSSRLKFHQTCKGALSGNVLDTAREGRIAHLVKLSGIGWGEIGCASYLVDRLSLSPVVDIILCAVI